MLQARFASLLLPSACIEPVSSNPVVISSLVVFNDAVSPAVILVNSVSGSSFLSCATDLVMLLPVRKAAQLNSSKRDMRMKSSRPGWTPSRSVWGMIWTRAGPEISVQCCKLYDGAASFAPERTATCKECVRVVGSVASYITELCSDSRGSHKAAAANIRMCEPSHTCDVGYLGGKKRVMERKSCRLPPVH